MKIGFHDPGRVDDRGGIKEGGAIRRLRGHGCPGKAEDGVALQEIGAGILPGGEGLADPRWSAAEADIAVPPAVVAEFRKAPVLLGTVKARLWRAVFPVAYLRFSGRSDSV